MDTKHPEALELENPIQEHPVLASALIFKQKLPFVLDV